MVCYVYMVKRVFRVEVRLMFFILCSLFFIIFLILCGVVIIKCQSANFEGCEYICY